MQYMLDGLNILNVGTCIIIKLRIRGIATITIYAETQASAYTQVDKSIAYVENCIIFGEKYECLSEMLV